MLLPILNKEMKQVSNFHQSIIAKKASNSVKWSISMQSFTWQCQIINWFKSESRPSSLHNLKMACRKGDETNPMD